MRNIDVLCCHPETGPQAEVLSPQQEGTPVEKNGARRPSPAMQINPTPRWWWSVE
jgi:hypothetical protein